MCREQKTAKAGYPCEGMVETESSKGARSIAYARNRKEERCKNHACPNTA